MSYAGSGGDDQSEDGELRHSPTDLKKSEDVMDFSLSEEDADTADSLDIKPPQASRVTHGKSKRRDKVREGRRHGRSERHREAERSHGHREKHHRERAMREREQKYEYREKEHFRERELYRAKEYLKSESYREVRVDRYEKELQFKELQYRREEARDVRYMSKYEEKRKEPDRYEKEREIRYVQEDKRIKSITDQTLDDFRERLLDKRRIKEEDMKSYERRKRERDDDATHDSDYVIDLSADDFKDKHKHKKEEKEWTREELQEKEEQEMRREKLLEAEREIARQKEQYRAERDRRHQQRLERQEAKRKLAAEQDPAPDKRQRLTNELSQYKNKAFDVLLLEDSESESEPPTDRSESERSDTERDSSSGESENSDYKEQSPMSVGNLAKSDRSSSGSPEKPAPDASPQAEPLLIEEDLETEIDESLNLPAYLPAVQGCRSVEEFQCLNRIEEGTYGVVYRARDKRTDEIVALKRLKMEKEKEGFPITSLREINTLLKGQHPNIVTVREIVVGSNMDKIFIVMDYVEHDLKSLMETMRHKKQVFVPGEVKCLLKQLLGAVAHLHDNWILHRDLKTSNLLLSHKGILKVGDFGLAREYGSPLKAYTPIVVTLWYRAPELLLCTKEYSTPIDMWSVGCIFAELLLMNALFPGKSEVDQLNRIFKDLGTPNEKIWPGYNELPAVKKMKFTEFPVSQLRNRFAMLSDLGRDLLQKFLTYDPAQRVTAEDALQHLYFTEAPLPIDPAMFPTWPAKSELGHRKALAASPKPPSGGREYKQLGDGDEDSSIGFHMGSSTATSLMEARRLAMGAGFSLKF